MNTTRRNLNVWKDPAAFDLATSTGSPWIGNNAWTKTQTSKAQTTKAPTTPKATPSSSINQSNTTKEIAHMQHELQQLKTLLETSNAKSSTQEENMEKMRKQITAEVKASIPETADATTVTTQITHQVNKLVQLQTQQMQLEAKDTKEKLTLHHKQMKEIEKQLDEKFYNLALKSATTNEKTKAIGLRLTDFETQTNTRISNLRQSVEQNTRNILELGIIASKNSETVGENNRQLSALIAALQSRTPEEEINFQPPEQDHLLDKSFDSSTMIIDETPTTFDPTCESSPRQQGQARLAEQESQTTKRNKMATHPKGPPVTLTPDGKENKNNPQHPNNDSSKLKGNSNSNASAAKEVQQGSAPVGL